MSEQKAESRKERREVARSRAILDVANALHMELVRSGRDYRWKEHDSFVITPDNNLWNWFSRHLGGDVISLVTTIKEVDFNQAVDFLNDGEFKTFQKVERREEPFNYYLKAYEQPFNEARIYLKQQRGLSDETIDFFLDKGVMAQANATVNGSIEPVIVFKSLNQEGEIIGAQLQGIEANWEKWPKRGYAKKIINNSDGMTGMHVDIGQPNRLIFTESAIDLMSYYELHKNNLRDVRLVSMDGVKESIVSRHLVELEAELSGHPLRWNREELSHGLATAIESGYFAEGKHADRITLAVDNDTGGHNFITSLQEKGVTLMVDIPDLPKGQDKADWNDHLRQEKQTTFESEQKWLEDNWDNITFSIERKEPNYTKQVIQEEIITDLPYLIRPTGKSYQLAGQRFRQGELVRFEDFVTALYQVNQDYHTNGNEEKVIFDVLTPNQEPVVRNFTYHLGSETELVSHLLNHRGVQEYEKLTLNHPIQSIISVADIQERLSTEADLDSTMITDEVLYTKTVNLDQGYALNLEVHSPEVVDNLSDTKAAWSLEVVKDNHSLGYLAYGEDWGNAFDIEEELTDLDHWLKTNQVAEHLYAQEEVTHFMASLSTEKEAVGEFKSFGTFIIDDDFLERHYGSVEHDKTPTEQPSSQVEEVNRPTDDISDTLAKIISSEGFDSYPINDQKTKWEHDKFVTFKGYQLAITIFSNSDELTPENTQNNWSMIFLGKREALGYVAYGEDFFNAQPLINEKLTELETGIRQGSIKKGLYTRQDYHQFLKSLKDLSRGDDKDVEDLVADSKQEELTPKSISYEDYKQETEVLEESLKQKISSGELSINVDDDIYAYMVFRSLGNSHPMKTLTDKRLTTLHSTDIIKQLKTITDENVDSYKTKGTPAQDNLYQALKANQKQLGLADVSTQFVGEMAIIAYNVNHRLSSLSQEQYHYNAVSMLSGMVRDVIEYPCIENGNDGFSVFIHSENALYRYLDQLSGDVTLTRKDLDKLIDTVSYHSPEVIYEDNKKSLEETQEAVSFDSEQHKKERTNGSQGSLQFLAESSPTPVPEIGTFERSVTSRPTPSSRLLYFSINEGFKSINDGRYHSITQNDLVKLNRKIRRQTIQNAAQYYLEELANSKFYYVTPEKIVQVNFEEKHFLHLTGIKPKGEGQNAVKTLHDFAEGNGRFDNIFLENNDAAFDKINVLSDLSVATESSSFYFDDLTDIQRYSGKFDSLLKSDDKDIILLFKELGEESYIPVSIFQSRVKIAKELETVNKTPILGVYRERDGHLEQLSINEEYINDNGEKMLSILQNKQYQEISSEQALEPSQPEVTAEDFTRVLDAVYNNGAQIGKDNRANIPEKLYPAWDKYDEYAKQYDNDFSQIVKIAEADQLLNKASDFYKAWTQDNIYEHHYHIRLQQLSDETPLPFDVTEFIDYQTFATELYQRNQDSQSKEEITPPTIHFALYAPEGELIKEEVAYRIGEENKPISQLLGLGYRRLAGYQDLAQIDEEVLFQLENHEMNQVIIKEEQATISVSRDDEPEMISEKQVLKTSFAKRVEEILNESPTQSQELPRTTDMTGHSTDISKDNKEKFLESADYEKITPHDLSQRALQKIREYTKSPEDLREYLDFMSRFPHLSPRNVALIQAQWPSANAVATYNQWQAMGESLGISEDDVIQTKATYVNKRTGNKKEVVHQGLSVKAGEKSQITLFRPQMERMIPVLDSNGNQFKNDKGNPKFKRLSQATPQEKALVKDKKLKVTLFQKRDTSGQLLYTTYKVFELSQTTLKPESYPKAMPNRHYNFDIDQVKTYEVLEGLCDYAKSLDVTILIDDANTLGNIKGVFNADRQEILINKYNTPGEKISTTIHELAHATLHNPKLMTSSMTENIPYHQAELEAEMTSYLVSKHFGLDTEAKAFRYIASWTDNLNALDDKALTDSLKRIHKTVISMVSQVEKHTKPYQRTRGQDLNLSQDQSKGMKR